MSDTVDPALLEQHWTHSHEEDTATEMVFRPASTKLPSSRGRRSFTLAASGELHATTPGADDRPSARTGRWLFAQPDQLELAASGPGGPTEQLKVLLLEPGKLVVAK